MLASRGVVTRVFTHFALMGMFSSLVLATPILASNNDPNSVISDRSKESIHVASQLRKKILNGPYGSSSIADLVQSLTDIPGGPEIQKIFQTLAVRKKEALPFIKKKLRTGSIWEKQKLTKYLQYSPNPEAKPELIALACDSREHWLSRQGALYALGELGDSSVGPEILPILSEPNCPRGIQLVAISTLARIGYRQAASTINFFTAHEDVHIRLFAYRALAEFGEPVDRQLLLSALNDQNYIVRQEACEALASLQGEDITQRLQSVAKYDFHESVRTAARIGTLERQIKGRSSTEKLDILRNAIKSPERRTTPWVLQTIIKKCGSEGRIFVEQLSLRNDRIGERAKASLIAEENLLSTSSSDQEIQSSGEIQPKKHASTPTHRTLMEYAISKAASLPTPLYFTSTQQTRMKEGTFDEDITWDILGESFRYLNHFYNPLTKSGLLGLYTPARDRAYNVWIDKMKPYFEGEYLDAAETSTQWGGAWQQLGRVSHLLQDMSSPLHILGQPHVRVVDVDFNPCKYEDFWRDNDSTLRSTLNSIGGPLHSGDPLPSESTAKLDTFTQERLQYRYNNSCPQKNDDDVRGWVDVLAWTTYFRVTFWGQVTFGSGDGPGPATSAQTTGTNFTDGYVDAKTNALHTMFNGKIQYKVSWDDHFYEITDRNGYVFRWMSWSDIDDWAACGQSWADGYKDSSIKLFNAHQYDDHGVRITGRFWFDTRELGKDASNHRCYPYKYPNGDSMTDDLHLYYGKYGYPLTVRYNAGLLGLANRQATVKTNSGSANFTLGRKDNFGNGPTFNTGTSGSNFYFVAKSSVTLEAPSTNSSGRSFNQWLKNGSSHSSSRTITINTSSNWIPQSGDIYTAEFVAASTRIIRLDGDLAFGSVTVGQSAQRTMTVYNDGSATLSVDRISYPSGFSGAYSGNISAASSADVTVTFTPTAETSYGGTVTVNSDKTSGTSTIAVSGTGTLTSTRIISLSGNLAFGSVMVDSSSQSTLTINNTGSSTMTISGISYPSGFSGDWSGTIAAGGSQSVTVTFSPTSAISYGGTITVASNASGTNTRSCSGTGVTTPGELSGSGTETDPYLIQSLSDFDEFANDSSYWDDHIRLECDIDLSGRTYSAAVISTFSGVFDGNDHVIRNFVINMPGSAYIGLFGSVGVNSHIHNIGVENVNVVGNYFVGGLVGRNDGKITASYVTGDIKGSQDIGGLVGYNVGTITTCYTTGNISSSSNAGGLVGGNDGGTLTGCYSMGNVSGSSSVGGLVGYNYYSSTLTCCYATGNVSGSSSVGGLVGLNYDTVNMCYATGTVSSSDEFVGGLVGDNWAGTTTNCYATGNVSGSSFAGGLVGRNFRGTVSHCYSMGKPMGESSVGGLCGYQLFNDSLISNCFWDTEVSEQTVGYNLDSSYPGMIDNVLGKTSMEMQTQSIFIDAGWNFMSTWDIVQNETYPFLRVFGSPQIDIPTNSPPTISEFNVAPSSVVLGNTFTISYTVADSGGSGLNRVELWRATDVNGDGKPDWSDDPNDHNDRIGTHYLSGKTSDSNSFFDTPLSAGTYWYGIDVYDNNGNWNDENNSETNGVPGEFGPNGKVTVTSPTSTVATPTILPNGGTFTGSRQVTLSCSTSGAKICYTTNGSDPTSSSTAYSSPITLTSSAMVKAKAFKSGYNASATATASFTAVRPLQVTKCTVTAGKKANSDKISFSGTMDATANNLSTASSIEVTIDSDDMDSPRILTFPINNKTWKVNKGKYSYSGTESGIKKSFTYNLKTRKFSFSASKVDLCGLACPLAVQIEINSYVGAAEVGEGVVNGPRKPIPIFYCR